MTEAKVGYKRPPKHSQFKPGNNANPLGRGARKRLKPGQIMLAILNRRETVSVGGKNKKMTVVERIVLRHGNDALRGSVDSALLLLRLRRCADSIGNMTTIQLVMSPMMEKL